MNKIISYTSDPQYQWLSELNHLSNSIPTINTSTRDFLEVIHPLVITRLPSANTQSEEEIVPRKSKLTPTHLLVAGYRTYQLLLEQEGSTQTTVLAIELPTTTKRDNVDLGVFDAITAKVLLSLNTRDLATIGGEVLENPDLYSVLKTQLPMPTTEDLAVHLGMSKPTFHRVTKPIRENIRSKKSKASEKRKVDLEINEHVTVTSNESQASLPPCSD